jgi:polysaccharide biosynthesis protein PelA
MRFGIRVIPCRGILTILPVFTSIYGPGAPVAAGFCEFCGDHAAVRKLLVLFLFVLSACIWAAPAPKRMLVVFKSSEKVSAKENQVRWHLEPALVKQGWKLDYHDVDASLPSDAQMAPYKAVASWHGTAIYKNPTEYVRWMRNQVVSGRKVLILGNFGAFTADEKTWLTNEVLNEFFLPFGLEYGAAYSGDASQLQVVAQNGPARAPKNLNYYLLFRSTNPENKPHVVVKRKDLEKSDSALVVTTPKGAMVAETFIYKLDGKKIDWLIDRDKLLAGALAAPAQDKLSSGGHLLALYKGTEGYDQQTNYISRFLAPTLKELGYTFDAYDINKGLPEAASMGKYSGVISWYQTASMENAAAYTRWLSDQILAGRKVVVLGNLGAFQELDKSSNPPTERWLLTHEYNTFMYPFGLEFKAAWTKDPAVLNVAQRDPSMIPYLEPQHIGHYYLIQSVHPENKPYLVLNRRDMKNSDSAIVVRTPYGGYALESYLFRDATGKGDYKWHVDMKKFLYDSLTYKPSKLPQPWAIKVTPSNPTPVPASATMPRSPALPAGTQEIKRRVLAFYQRDMKDASDNNKIHAACETFLNHLGLVVDYRAIEDGLPSAAEMAPYRGIITWFAGASVPNAQAYAEWLKSQIEGGKKVVIIGDYGAYQDKSLTTQVNPGPTMKALGIDWRAASPVTGITHNRVNLVATHTPTIEYADPEMTKGERPINLNDPDLKKGWPVYLSADPANKVYLKVKDKEGQVSDAVVVTPHGAVVAGEFLLYTPPAQPIRAESVDPSKTGPAVADEVEIPELRINAFRFFEEAFQTADLPKCDVTTLNGSRIYFSHIDGDAMQGMSFIDRASLNAEMLYREILSVIPLPVTVSFVTNNLEFRATPTYKRELEAARKILALPWIEVASHTTTHPFNWRLGDLKRRPGDDSGGLVRIPPDNKYEIINSIDFTNQLVKPANKQTKVLLWSGMTNPTEESLALCDAMGVTNMNGGDPVYDSIHPNQIGVSPLYRVVGGRYQFHTCAAGDFYYTGAWTRDYDGMKRLVEYFKYTEEPRRLRAMNLYYHFYLAERELGIQGLKIAMDYVIGQRPAPMFVSNYVDIVKDMIVSKLGTDEQGNIVVANTGAMRTLRMDNQPKVPDLARSQGVLGYQRTGNRLYIHLDDSAVHRIAMGDKPAANRLYVERASHYVNQWKPAGNDVSFALKGTGPASFTLAGMGQNTPYKVSVAGVGEKTLRTDAAGKLTWEGTLSNYEGTYAVRISR